MSQNDENDVMLFVILQKYDFSSKSQLGMELTPIRSSCLWYCKSTIFQANHNKRHNLSDEDLVVCDTAKVRFFKQITTNSACSIKKRKLFVILQKYDFSSKSQPEVHSTTTQKSCLWYCKSTIFQANHNIRAVITKHSNVVCDTAKVRFFKQITTNTILMMLLQSCLWYCKSTIFQANHNNK